MSSTERAATVTSELFSVLAPVMSSMKRAGGTRHSYSPSPGRDRDLLALAVVAAEGHPLALDVEHEHALGAEEADVDLVLVAVGERRGPRERAERTVVEADDAGVEEVDGGARRSSTRPATVAARRPVSQNSRALECVTWPWA